MAPETMREPGRLQDLGELIRRHEAAVESFQKIAHYADKQHMGRAMTADEADTLATRNGVMAKALTAVILFPDQTFSSLRTKTKYLLSVVNTGQSLGRDDQKRFFNTILSLSKHTEIEDGA